MAGRTRAGTAKRSVRSPGGGRRGRRARAAGQVRGAGGQVDPGSGASVSTTAGRRAPGLCRTPGHQPGPRRRAATRTSTECPGARLLEDGEEVLDQQPQVGLGRRRPGRRRGRTLANAAETSSASAGRKSRAGTPLTLLRLRPGWRWVYNLSPWGTKVANPPPPGRTGAGQGAGPGAARSFGLVRR